MIVQVCCCRIIQSITHMKKYLFVAAFAAFAACGAYAQDGASSSDEDVVSGSELPVDEGIGVSIIPGGTLYVKTGPGVINIVREGTFGISITYPGKFVGGNGSKDDPYVCSGFEGTCLTIYQPPKGVGN